MKKNSQAKSFKHMEFDDKDLIMFTITDLKLEKSAHGDQPEEEDPNRDVDHLLANRALAGCVIRHHLLQANLL